MKATRLSGSKLSIRSSLILLDWQKKIHEVIISVSPNQELLYFFINDRLKPRRVIIKLAQSASVKFYGICMGNSGDQVTDIIIDHVKPQSQSFTSLKGVFTGTGRGTMNGTIHIHKDAQGSSARLEERVLLLSSESSAKTIPNLEIEANDVKASHAATVSRLSEEEIFYLQTRGLSRETSINALVSAFLMSQLKHLPDENVRGKIQADTAKLLR